MITNMNLSRLTIKLKRHTHVIMTLIAVDSVLRIQIILNTTGPQHVRIADA